MAFEIPHDQFYSTTIYPNDFCDLPPPSTTSSVGAPLGPLSWGAEETLVPLFDDFGLHPTPIDPSSFSDHHQQPLPLPQLMNTTAGTAIAAANNSGCQNFCLAYPFPDNQFYEFGDDCFPLVPDIKPIHNYHPLIPSADHWEIQSNNPVPVTEDSNMKVGRYSEEVRKERILRYLKKRNQRNFNKTIKYACRKTLADRRIRVRGRFARNNEACDQQLNPTNNNDTSMIIHEHNELLYNHDVGVQMKKDEEEWLQEITSLMYLPYISS